jgi:hypothetical protein
VIAFFAGGGVYLANEATANEQTAWTWGSGLIGLLVLFSAVALAFTGRYPQRETPRGRRVKVLSTGPNVKASSSAGLQRNTGG